MKISFNLKPSERWLEDIAFQFGTSIETSTTFAKRFGDSHMRVNAVPFNKDFIPLVSEFRSKEPVHLCKEAFDTNEYWTLQVSRSTRKHKIELKDNVDNKISIEAFNSCVFYSSKMVVDMQWEGEQHIRILSINLHRDWLCEQLGVKISTNSEDAKIRELLMSERASCARVAVFPDWIDELIKNENTINWRLSLQAKCLQLIADVSPQLRNPQLQLINNKLNLSDLHRIEAIKEKYFSVNQVLPTIDFLAREAGMSVSKFKKCFKIRFGAAPYEYHLNQKLEVAKVHLLENRVSIAEIASQLGYTSTANFDKAFKKKFLVNPSTMLRNAS